jgi:hypothetical protein
MDGSFGANASIRDISWRFDVPVPREMKRFEASTVSASGNDYARKSALLVGHFPIYLSADRGEFAAYIISLS